ncbi:MAG: hypothetical protein BWY05_01159 [Euryarchaeota archaeon ADurb.Bin165]|nr:MAG: hypothetical protein BWY05_01159 [Euryarchaeota archaeon ADurb.Bin165]
MPSHIASRPECENPNFLREARRVSSFSPENAVLLIRRPSREPTFPPSISSMWPMVIRDGIAWGLMTRSGVRPPSVKGISTHGEMSPTTPFCPCLDANLSPTSGTRRSRVLTFTSFELFSPSVRMTVSTMPCSFERMVTDVSRRFSTVISSEVGSSRKRGGDVFPMMTSFSLTTVSGLIIPSSSRFA